MCMKKFIYVFNEDDKNTLLSKGYVLLKTVNDNPTIVEKNYTYIFENNPIVSIETFENLKYIKSNTLMF